MAHKRIRNNRFHYTVTSKLLPNGRVYLTFDDEAEGDEYTKKLDALLAAGKVPTEFMSKPGAIVTVADAVDQYLINLHVPESDQLLLAIARKRVGSTNISKLDYAWADKYVSGMKEKKLSPSTIRHHVGALARCFDWIKRRGDTLMISNPLRELPKRYASGHKEEFERDRRLSPAEELEIRRILQGGKPANKERGFEFNNPQEMLMLFEIAIETGMRMSEIYTLEKEQIDLDGRTIFLDKTKNGDRRQVPMTSTVHLALKAYIETLHGSLLFSFEGKRKDISSRLSQTFARVFDAAGCGDFTFHGLRHEATSRFYERTTLSDLEIAKILGWKSLKMALTYSNLRASNLAVKLW
jgi:integrase